MKKMTSGSMTNGISHLFWDSCVFYAFLADNRASYDVDSIAQYLREAKDGKHRIYTSTLILAEVTPSSIKKSDIGTIQDFIDDLQGAVVLIDPTPNIMLQAAQLKDLPYNKANCKARRLSTPDAIILASCADVARDVRIDLFHTFDDGKKRDPVDGKMVPLISYEDWCGAFTPQQLAIAKPVLDLNRRKPIHPSPPLPGMGNA
jgi:predicted nucleic acid-binding protein